MARLQGFKSVVPTSGTSSSNINYKDSAKTRREIERQNNANSRTYADTTNLLNYSYTLDERARQFETDYAVTAIQRQQLRDQYIAAMRNRDIQMNAQLGAYGASADRTAQQLQFNTAAGEQAYDLSEQRLIDRLKGIDFSVRGEQINRQSQLGDLASQYAASRDALRFAENTYRDTSSGITAQYDEAVRAAGQRQLLSDAAIARDRIETYASLDNQYDEAQISSQNQRSEAIRAVTDANANAINSLTAQTLEANRSAVVQAGELMRSAGVQASELTRATGVQAQELITSTANERTNAITAAENRRTESIRSATEQQRLAKASSKLQYDSAFEEIENALENQQAISNYQIQEQQIQQLVSSGQVSSRGNRGSSAQRALRTLGVLSSTNQAKLASDITRFKRQQEQSKLLVGRRKTIADEQADEVLLSATNQGNELVRGVTATADEAVRAAGIRSAEMKLSAANRAAETTTAAANRATEIATSALNTGVNAVKKLTAENAERLKATTNQAKERERSIMARAAEASRSGKQRADNQLLTINASNAESKLAAENAAKISRDIATNRAYNQISNMRDRTATDRAAIQQRQNIMLMRSELTLEELGNSMVSAMNAFQQDKQTIFMDKFQADAAAIAQMMTKPQFADAPPTPYVIPDPEFIVPPVPIEVPKSQIPPSPPSQSGLSKALTIAGAVVGAAAAPLTLGASLFPATIGAQAGAYAAFGGSILSGIGQMSN